MFSGFFASLISGELSGAVRRLRIAAMAYFLAALALLCSIGFLTGATFIIAAERWGAASAAAGFAIGFLVLGMAILLSGKLLLRKRARAAERKRMAETRMLAEAAALTLLPSLLARKSGAGALLLPLAAFVSYAIYRENTHERRENRDSDIH